jgi:hypothetical protein
VTTATALGQLRDAIRAEVIAELVERLETWRDNLSADTDGGYLDGINDSIITIHPREDHR